LPHQAIDKMAGAAFELQIIGAEGASCVPRGGGSKAGSLRGPGGAIWARAACLAPLKAASASALLRCFEYFFLKFFGKGVHYLEIGHQNGDLWSCINSWNLHFFVLQI